MKLLNDIKEKTPTSYQIFHLGVRGEFGISLMIPMSTMNTVLTDRPVRAAIKKRSEQDPIMFIPESRFIPDMYVLSVAELLEGLRVGHLTEDYCEDHPAATIDLTCDVKPFYHHHCERCTYVCSDEAYDVYLHTYPDAPDHLSLLNRFGSDVNSYASIRLTPELLEKGHLTLFSYLDTCQHNAAMYRRNREVQDNLKTHE